MNGPNKLECYVTFGQKRLVGYKHSSILDPFRKLHKMKYCEYGPRCLYEWCTM